MSIRFLDFAHLSGRRVPIALVALGRGCIVFDVALLVTVPSDQFVAFAPCGLILNQTIGIGQGFRLRVAVSDPVLQLGVGVSGVPHLLMLPVRGSVVIVPLHLVPGLGVPVQPYLLIRSRVLVPIGPSDQSFPDHTLPATVPRSPLLQNIRSRSMIDATSSHVQMHRSLTYCSNTNREESIDRGSRLSVVDRWS